MKILLRRMKKNSPNGKDRKSWKLCKMKWIYQLRSCSDVILLEEVGITLCSLFIDLFFVFLILSSFTLNYTSCNLNKFFKFHPLIVLDIDIDPSVSRETSPDSNENDADLASVGHGEGELYKVFIMYW